MGVTTEDITDTVIPDTTGVRIISSKKFCHLTLLLITIHIFLAAAIFKFKKSKFDDRNYCVNIHQIICHRTTAILHPDCSTRKEDIQNPICDTELKKSQKFFKKKKKKKKKKS